MRPIPGLYCTNVEVPMDYHNSSAGTANLAVIKYTAAAPGKSKGSVFINPGVYPCQLLRVSALIDLWKAGLVGAEPPRSRPLVNPSAQSSTVNTISCRGTPVGAQATTPRKGASRNPRIHHIYPAHSPGTVTCFGSFEEEVSFWQGTPIAGLNVTVASNFTDKEVEDLYATLEYTEMKMSMYSNRCEWGPVGRYLQYIGTSSTVRDLVALGDKIVGPGEPINYWGFSYGTILGFHFINSECICRILGHFE